MSTTETQEIVIADMTINDMRDLLASSYTVELPKSWKRAQIVEVLTAALEGNTEVLAPYIVKPLSTEGTTKNPITLTPDQLAAKVQQHKENLDVAEVERLKKAAEKSKPKKLAYELTLDELARRTNKIGYAVGVLGWALNRISKESGVVNTILNSLEDYDDDSVSVIREALASGYAKSYDQFHQPSKACSSPLEGSDLLDAIVKEIWTNLDNPTSHRSILEQLAVNPPVNDEPSTEEPIEQ